MRRISHARLRPLAPALALVLGPALALAVSTGIASAYWTNAGQSNVSASLATLPAPTIERAVAGAEAVELEWSPVIAPAPGTVEYYVSRDGAPAGPGCPGSSSTSTETSCTDTNVPVGSHKYTVTAVWRSWTASGAEQTLSVAYGPATHLVLEAASTSPLAGERDNLTVTAKDAGNRTVGTYTGAHDLVFEGAGESATGENPVVSDAAGVEQSFGGTTEIDFNEGKSTVSVTDNGAMKLYKAETAHIKVKEGALNNGAGLVVTVKAALSTKRFTLSTGSEPTAGTAFNVSLSATDEWGNTTTGYAGAKTILWSGPSSSPSGKAPTYPATVTFTAGLGTASIKLYDAQSTTLKAIEGAIEGTSASLAVRPAAVKKLGVATPAEQEAGVAFSVTLTALDEYSNVATSYAGAKILTWSGPANAPSGRTPEYPTSATTVTFSEGVGTAIALKLFDAQSTTIKAKEGTVEGTSAAFTVKAAAVASFSLSTPTEREAGVAFSETVTAWDAWHNTAKGYVGAKAISWSGPAHAPNGLAPLYPATVTFAAGVGTASIKLYDAQATALTATEGAAEGSSSSFTVKAAATKKFSVPTPSEQVAGVAFNVTLTATDEWGNLAKTYTGTKTLVLSGPATAPAGQAPEYPASATSVTFAEGVGTSSAIKLSDAQSTTLKAKEGSAVEGTSGAFAVSAGEPERLAWSHAEVTAGTLEAGSCPFACKTTSIGNNKKFKARLAVTDRYGNVVTGLGSSRKVKVEKTAGEGTLAGATGLTILASGLAETTTIVEYTSPASGTSEAVLKLKLEGESVTYTEAEAHVKY